MASASCGRSTRSGRGDPFRVPAEDLLPERLAAVLAVVYLIFNAGYGGSRRAGERGVWLGRALAELMPDEPEVHGLLAMMPAARRRREARVRDGDLRAPRRPGPLVVGQSTDRQGPRRARPGPCAARSWPLRRASGKSRRCTLRSRATGPDRRPLRRAHRGLTDSPIVELNRAVAVPRIGVLEAGLELIDRLPLEDYHYLPRDARRAATAPRSHRRGPPTATAARWRSSTTTAERRLLQRRLSELRLS